MKVYLKQDADGARVQVTQEQHMIDYLKQGYVKIVDSDLLCVYRAEAHKPSKTPAPINYEYGGRGVRGGSLYRGN